MYCEKKSNYLIRWRYLCSSSLLYGLCSSYVPTSASISNGLPELARHMLCSHEPIATPIFLFIFEVGVTISPLKPRNYRVEWNWFILYVIVCSVRLSRLCGQWPSSGLGYRLDVITLYDSELYAPSRVCSTGRGKLKKKGRNKRKILRICLDSKSVNTCLDSRTDTKIIWASAL